MNSLKSVLALSALLYATASPAIVLDFEGFSAGTIIDDEYFASFGVTVSAAGVGGAPNAAVVFDSNNPTGGDTDLAAPFQPGPGNTLGEISPGNLLILQENGPCDASSCTNPDDQGARPAGTMNFVFTGSVFLESIDFFDIEGLEIGDVVLYDSVGGIIATLTIPSTGGDRLWQRLAINTGGVAAMDINMGGSGAIDNLQFAVPVPGALLLMASAMGSLGLVRRRRTA